MEYVLTTTQAVSVTGSVAKSLRDVFSQALHGVTSYLQQVGPTQQAHAIAGVPIGFIWIGIIALLIGLVLIRNS